ncbi:hypothetical protein SELMODRAFT_411928 [Selaginella moellendorffii]|uniref:Tubulin epsilon and delta complex protein 1 domain-containing protein n=1 Tax=Selaginella moellendorffii TaxID=88036 RepID=D8RJH0_SELML|nr:uncharacterized protein LOC9642073 [Selaginella moellendorffii]EFJ27904.1 hypothetical protein SELMODRAFT_411928 [Selaginella moellendorffii]|eukprot:XP_002971306.1 uncharacterized protein LOC9642073 [Selaginella moellendorffii]
MKETKASLAFLCSLLESLGVAGVTPDLLRQAKSNAPCAAIKLWRPLHDVVCLHLCCFPCQEDHRELEGFQEIWRSSGVFSDDHGDGIVGFVKFYVALWGYLPSSRFFGLPIDTRESRELLLALGWLLSHCDVFLRGIEARSREISSAIASSSIAAPFPPLPRDVATLAGSRAREVELGVEELVSKVLHSAAQRDREAREGFLADHLLMLHGRIGVILKSIHSLQASRFRRIHELNQLQLEAIRQKIQHRLYTQFELHLLQDPEAARDLQRVLEAERQLRSELASFQKHEENFWNWMADENDDEIATPARSLKQEPSSCCGVSQEELIPVIQFLKDPKDQCGVSPVPSEILAVLAPAFTTMNHASCSSKKRGDDRAAFGRLRDAGFKYQPSSTLTTIDQSIQRLEEAIDKLTIGHKELRDQHRIAIERELKSFLEDESFVVVGL